MVSAPSTGTRARLKQGADRKNCDRPDFRETVRVGVLTVRSGTDAPDHGLASVVGRSVESKEAGIPVGTPASAFLAEPARRRPGWID